MEGYRLLQVVARDRKGLQGRTSGYMGFQDVTIGLQGVTSGYKMLQWVTRGYKGL